MSVCMYAVAVGSDGAACRSHFRRQSTMMMVCRSNLAAVLLLLLGCSSLGMAVDRSKFRTCSQTSFCRRHRENHSSRLYQYKLDPTSVKFHLMDKEHASAAEDHKAGLWKSLQQRILGHGNQNADPYVRGPPPTLTGNLFILFVVATGIPLTYSSSTLFLLRCLDQYCSFR